MTRTQGRLLILLSCIIIAGLFVVMALPNPSPRDEVSMRVAADTEETTTTTEEPTTTTSEATTTTTEPTTTTVVETVEPVTTTTQAPEPVVTTTTVPPPTFYSAALTINVPAGEETVNTGAGYPDRYVDLTCTSSVPGGQNSNPSMNVHLEGISMHNYLYTFSGTGYEGFSVTCTITGVGVTLSHSGQLTFSSDLAIIAEAA